MNPKFASSPSPSVSVPSSLPPPHPPHLLPTPWLYVEVPMVTLTPSKVTVMEGENMELSCTTSGVPSPELIWDMALVSNYEVRFYILQTHT